MTTADTLSDIEAWGFGCAERLAADPRTTGVLVGGSIARGQHWEHSDLEVGVLIERRDAGIPYFNVDSGRGVEIIQLESAALAQQVRAAEAGDAAVVAQWPIQLYRGRVVADPTGVLSRFVTQFERLFDDDVIELRLAQLGASIRESLSSARDLAAAGRPRSATVRARSAMNDRVLMQYWQWGELPRSQNRVEARLRQAAAAHGEEGIHRLFRDVFDLDTTAEAIANDWPDAKAHVLELAELWEGDSSRAFFETAVDGTFSWGLDDSIICAYRLYIPAVGAPDAGIFERLDDDTWARENPALLRFLGLAEPSSESAVHLLDRIDHSLPHTVSTATQRVSERA